MFFKKQFIGQKRVLYLKAHPICVIYIEDIIVNTLLGALYELKDQSENIKS